MSAVGFIGLGAMGGRMAQRLLDAGHELAVWNRTASRAQPLVDAGARLAETPADAARDADVVITMVADPDALREVTSGPDGALAGLGPDAVLAEMSTVGPRSVHALAAGGARVIDAPVLGSTSEAEEGRLRVFVGGDDDLVARARPVLEAFGEPAHLGPLGAGAAAKLVANSTLLGVLCLLGEAIALGDHLGLARDATFDVLAKSPLAAQAERRREPVERHDFPHRFGLALARKDAELILAAAGDSRMARAAHAWFEQADQAGWGDADYSAILAYILGEQLPG